MTATIEFDFESELLTNDEIKKVLIQQMVHELEEWINGERMIGIEFNIKYDERNKQFDCSIN